MQKILTAVAAACLFPIAAQASVIYQFETTGAAVGVPSEVEHPGEAFDGISLTLALDETAWQAGAIRDSGTGCDVAALDGLRVEGGPVNLCVPDIQGELVELDLQFLGSEMSGSMLLTWDSGGQMIQLTSLPSGLWSGIYGSEKGGDGCFGVPCTLEGRWTLIAGPSAVPEPGSLALIAFGLAAVVTARSRISGRRPW